MGDRSTGLDSSYDKQLCLIRNCDKKQKEVRMSKTLTKRMLFGIMLLVMMISPLIFGCSCSLNLFASAKLDTPQITLYEDSKCITWSPVKNAYCYYVYCNDEFVAQLDKLGDADVFVYDFTNDLIEVGDYNFKVVAISASQIFENSESSNQVSYNCLSVPVFAAPDIDMTVNSIPVGNDNIIVNINATVLSFHPNNNNAESYELYLYSNTTGLSVYPVDLSKKTNTGWYEINLLDDTYDLKNEIYAIRIGTVNGDSHIVCSDIYYINPDSYGKYTSAESIYFFDGQMHDLYIESFRELRNLVYKCFIYRIPSQEIKISRGFESLLYTCYCTDGESSVGKALASAVLDSFYYFVETRDGYSISTVLKDSSVYSIEINYDNPNFMNNKGKPEPEISLLPPYFAYDEIDWDAYYEICDHTMREDDPKYQTEEYDDFVSDKQFLYTEVESSEELFWAVENRITPVCVPNSSAERIYSIAKTVLNSIISDDMTDYEKTLSIFDWICCNTSYDYYATMPGSYNGVSVNLVPAFYLEGVFDTGYAVCDGFSKAFSLMCNMEGIKCYRITGEAVSGYDSTGKELIGGHAWNKVKLDLNPNDQKSAEYYVVDITWTELVSSKYFNSSSLVGHEVSSHEYFLVDELTIMTHIECATREKYEHFFANSRFDYYNDTTYQFDAKAYGLLNTLDTTTYDLVIDSDADLQAMLYYILTEARHSIEVVFNYNYMQSVHISKGGTRFDSYNEIIKTFLEHIRSLKFSEQYLTINNNSYSLIKYNSKGDEGCIIIIEQQIMFDGENEAGHMLNFMSHYKVYGDYELFITQDVLSKQKGDTIMERAANIFKAAGFDIKVEFLSEFDQDMNGIYEYYRFVNNSNSPQYEFRIRLSANE